MDAKITNYGSNTRFSPKQVQKLQQIIGPLPKGSRSSNHFSVPQRHRQKPRRSYTLAREARWLARSFLRNLVFPAAIIGSIVAYNAYTDTFAGTAPSLVAAIPPSNATRVVPNPRFSVTDGDTIRVSGESRGTRLIGFNAPEIGNARCSRERELGHRATSRLKQLITSGEVSLQKVACSCRPGTEGTNACNHGRSCGVLRVNGRDVGQILISEGLAVRFQCGATSCPRTPSPWCG